MTNKNTKLLLYSTIILTIIACGTPQPSSGGSSPLEPAEPDNANPPANQSNSATAAFDLSTANDVAPSDILQEIEYYGQGGRDCYDASYPEVKIDYPPTDEELMIQSTMISCGWQEDEIVTGTIMYPDGRSFSQTIELEQDMSGNTYAAKLRFAPTLDDPAGTYTYILEGESGRVQAEANFQSPHGPRLFDVDQQHVLLYGFAPQEVVNLYCYASSGGNFIAWQEFQVDSSGQLIINIPTNKCNFAAIGTLSGEVHLLDYLAHGGTVDWVDYQLGSIRIRVYCNSLPSRVDVGDHADVAYVDGSNTRIRQEPGFSQTILDKVPEGTQLTILDGPECADESTWWNVRTESGQEGWMAEYQEGTYLIERLP